MKDKIRILCYGDSNTWGYISGSDHLRYKENERWTKLLQKQLGGYEIIEEGLNSRTLFSEDTRPGKEGRNGWAYLKPCLDTHDKIDTIILMLGTNELKNTFNNSAKDIVQMIDKYVDFIKNYKSQIDKSTPQIIISGVPLIRESTAYCQKDEKFRNAGKKSEELNILCKNHFKNKIVYIDNSDLQTGPDGVHMTKEAHKLLAEKICKVLEEDNRI